MGLTSDHKAELKDIVNWVLMPKIKDGNQNIGIFGEVQSGKTECILETCLMLLNIGKIPIVFVKSSKADAGQLKERISMFNDAFKNNAFISDASNLGSFKEIQSEDDINEIFTSFQNNNMSRCVYVCLANHVRMKKINDAIEHGTQLDKNLFKDSVVGILDEADQVLINVDEDKNNQVELEFKKFHGAINSLIQITATSLPLILINKDKPLTLVSVLPVPSDYIGIGSQYLVHIPTKAVKGGGGRSSHYDPWADISNLQAIMQDLLYTTNGVLLINTSGITKDHNNIVSCLKRLTNNSADICFVEFNDKNTKIEFGGKTQSWKCGPNEKVGTISKVLDYIKNDGFIERNGAKTHGKFGSVPKQIVIVAGNKASRGISFKSTDGVLHLTHQYLARSEQGSLDSGYQFLRILGRYSSNPQLKLYCSDSIFEQIKVMVADIKRIQNMAKQGNLIENDIIPLMYEYQNKFMDRRKENSSEYIKQSNDEPIPVSGIEQAKNIYVIDNIVQTNSVVVLDGVISDELWSKGMSLENKQSGTSPLRDAVKQILENKYNIKFNQSGMIYQELSHGEHYFKPLEASYKKCSEIMIVGKIDGKGDKCVIMKNMGNNNKPIEPQLDDVYVYHTPKGMYAHKNVFVNTSVLKKKTV